MSYLYGAFVIVGLALMFIAVIQYQNTAILLKTGVKTTATVIELKVTTDSDGDSYTPVFEYLDGNKNPIIFQSKVSSYPAPYQIGEKVQIIYNPDDYDDVKTISYWGLYRWTIILLVFAAPFLIIGGGYFLYRYY